MSDQNPTAQVARTDLESGTYEVIRERLNKQSAELSSALRGLNETRKTIFGAVPTQLIATERITTKNNCVPRDLVALGENRFLFGYNVHIGLKSETDLSDVFDAYQYRDQSFHQVPLPSASNKDFLADFRQLYKYYKNTTFVKFSIIGPYLFMVFRVGRSVTDIKTFKWLLQDGDITYEGNRSDHEFHFPPQHEFEWTRTHRDLHRAGPHPHISVQDRLFVETIHGDLTIKIEDNTDTGAGIYSEPVQHQDQTLDDAEVFFATVGNLILLRIRPYQESAYRLFVFNEKLKEVRRIDAMEDSCVLLPDEQGIIFSSGYYTQLGAFKEFPSGLTNMLFERRIPAPNGEDYLYVFYNRLSGTYCLMSYNIIEQKVEAPIICHGYTIFENGELAYFKAEEKPHKHHTIQIWQTPYQDHNLAVPEKKDSYLYKVGNATIVRCMAECHRILALLEKEDSYADLYVDLARAATDLIDSYFWLDHPDAFHLKSILAAIRQTASGAVDEFEKVVRFRAAAGTKLDQLQERVRHLLKAAAPGRLQRIDQFVETLSQFRAARGEIIAARETRYIDLDQLTVLEEQVQEQSASLSQKTVEFLLQPAALDPYRKEVDQHAGAVSKIAKVTESRELASQMSKTGGHLEMLIDVVSNLKIDDATQTTSIIDNISGIYASLNQAKSRLKQQTRQLQQTEGAAQFASQIRLLDQSVVNYLELCDTPDRCDDFLTKIMVQVQELESQFADFDDYQVQLAEKREQLYAAFENRKVSLLEARNKRAHHLQAAAERILQGIEHRLQQFHSVTDIHGFYASDLMVDRVRDIIQQLEDLQDTVKSSNLHSRLKSIREDALRQLKDRLELFADGNKVIQFGKHKFSVNSQDLELAIVPKDDNLFFHLTGTNYFEPVDDPAFDATRQAWQLESPSETDRVYRGEFLAFQFLQHLEESHQLDQALSSSDPDLLALVQQFMAPRYQERYTKGIHDLDAARILRPLLQMHQSLGLLRFPAAARACASVFWSSRSEHQPILAGALASLRLRGQLFPAARMDQALIQRIRQQIHTFCTETTCFPPELAEDAALYLFQQLTHSERFAVSPEAAQLTESFQRHLHEKHFSDKFEQAAAPLRDTRHALYQLTLRWLESFAANSTQPPLPGHLKEAAAILLRGGFHKSDIVRSEVQTEIGGMAGSHPAIQNGSYQLNYNDFTERLTHHLQAVLPLYQTFNQLKLDRAARKRQELRLDEFKPRVLSSFVRNKLINDVYLPLIGDNLAKQIGVAGKNTRTDRMGLLLLVSPPGYGKTTLMEYIANRLGLIFMKISGPAIGHRVTSLDPAEATNASAREELAKINLALEMGDNIMLYLDDIQHCHPELLQKFISLCDAQRKIEGVRNGRARTYDLRGKRVAVVMAGNPYTESGDKFKIPDMLANRADTYNLGDIVGSSDTAFKMSYIENALTSNPILNHLSARSHSDIYTILKIAGSGSREGAEFEANYSPEELNDMVSVVQKLLRIRDVILKVNLEYIRSAAQADEFRTEPPFRMQGSYRNMNRLAEKVLPIMDESELEDLILDHYRNESQTLTTGAEANLLKFKELLNKLSPQEEARWEEIKRTFKRNQLFRGADQNDPVGRLLSQLAVFSESLETIRTTLADGFDRFSTASNRETDWITPFAEQIHALNQHLEGIHHSIQAASQPPLSPAQPNMPAPDAKPSAPPPFLEHISNLSLELQSIQKTLADSLNHQRQQATFRLVDPASKADYQIASVSQDTLAKIWALVDQDRQARPQPTSDSSNGPDNQSSPAS